MKAEKTKIELSSGAARPSRIRRDPPPPQAVKQTVLPDDSERETWIILIGVLLFGLSIAIIILGASDYTAS